MTAQTAQQKLTARVAKLSTVMLKGMAAEMMVDQREGSQDVLSTILDVLMGRLPDADFVAFCETLP